MSEQKNYIEINEQPPQRHGLCRYVLKGLLFVGSVLTFIRNFIANAVMLLVIAFAVIAYNAASSLKEQAEIFIQGGGEDRETVQLRQSAKVVEMDLSGVISEMPLGSSRLDALQRTLQSTLNRVDYHEITVIEESLKLIAQDDDIECLYIKLNNLQPLSMAMAKRIASKVDLVRQSGKRVIAQGFNLSQSAYLIACAASEIILDPLGEIALRGLSVQSLYFKELLDNANLTPYVFKAGAFKSAVEPYTQNAMSDEVKAEYRQIIHSLWSDYERTAGQYRKVLSRSVLLPRESQYMSALNLYDGNTALMQQESNLCDLLMTASELKTDLIAKYGADPKHSLEPLMIDYQSYLHGKAGRGGSEHRVAVIYGVGTIVDDYVDNTTFCPDNLIPVMDRVMESDQYEAVILYLNSPGGSVIPSELMRRKVMQLRDHGLKVYVSINGTGASGAYMVALGADNITATSDSIVGSIGVFGVSFGLHDLTEKLGARQDGTATHEFLRPTPFKPLTENQKALQALRIDNIYNRFIGYATQARQLDKADYLQFAEGRVFTADQALSLGLIDKVGTLDDVYAEVAADLGTEVEDLDLRHLSPQSEDDLQPLREILFRFGTAVLPEGLTELLGDYLTIKEQVADGTSEPRIEAVSLAVSPLLD